MRKVEIEIFKYEELSEKGKRKAFDKFNEYPDYHNHTNNIATLKGFQAVFPVHVTDWAYGQGDFRVDYTFLENDDIEELKGVRLATYINNNYHADLFQGKYYSTTGKYIEGKYVYKNRRSKTMLDNSCVLTGYYLDDVILKPIYEFLKNPTDKTNFKSLMTNCLNMWALVCNDDYDDYHSEESFKEMCESNEWEFHADGSMF